MDGQEIIDHYSQVVDLNVAQCEKNLQNVIIWYNRDKWK